MGRNQARGRPLQLRGAGEGDQPHRWLRAMAGTPRPFGPATAAGTATCANAGAGAALPARSSCINWSSQETSRESYSC